MTTNTDKNSNILRQSPTKTSLASPNTNDTQDIFNPLHYSHFTFLHKHPYSIAFIIILIGSLIRFWFIASGQLNLSPDEAQYWDWSRTLQLSYYSKGPLISWNIAFWCKLLGDSEFAVRFGAVFNSILVQIILFFGVSTLLRRKMLAVLCLVVANTMPLFLASAILMTTDSPLLVSWICAFFALYVLSSEIDDSSKNWQIKTAYIVLFLAMAFGNLAKYMMLAFFVVALPYLYILHKNALISLKRIKNIIL